MLLRADQGFYLTNIGGQAEYDPTKLINTVTGAYLSEYGIWINALKKSQKTDIVTVDGKDILEKLSSIQVSRWSFKEDEKQVNHISPDANDFNSIFGVGEDDQSLSSVDPSGIALAAIQELHKTQKKLEIKAARVDDLATQVESMSNELSELKYLIGRLLDGQNGTGSN